MDQTTMAANFGEKLGEPTSTATIKNLDIPGGKLTESYEKYVRRLFSPADQQHTTTSLAGYVASEINAGNPIPDIPASLMLKMERMEDGDEAHPKMYSPLDLMYSFYDKYGLEDVPYAKYPVYQTKSSSLYHSTKNRKPRVGESPAICYKVARTSSTPNVWTGTASYDKPTYRVGSDSRRFVPPAQTHHLLIDYGNFPSSPLSPFLYPQHSFVHREDSRIVGSDFVMLTLRPQDPFLNRIDKLLQEAKKF